MKKHEILSKYNLSRGAYYALINLGKIVVHSRCNSEIIDEDFVKSFNYEKYKQEYHNSEEYKKKISERNTKVNQARWLNISEEARLAYKEKCRQSTLKSQKEHPEQLEQMRQSLKNYWSNEKNRKAQSEKMLEVYKNEEKRQHISDGCKLYWSSKENRLSQSERMLSYWPKHPEKIAQMKETNRQTQLELWDNDKKIRQSDITKSILHKIYKTKKKNCSFNSSKPEQLAKELLEQKFNKVYYQYKCDRYPFNCDFYIEDLDLFIELNFTWTHGYGPYNEKAQWCKEQLANWREKAKTSKFYQNAIETWTIKDIEKAQCAKDNKLNYKIFYTYEDFEKWLNDIA